MNWYYESGGQQQGPVTETDLDRLLSEGKINPDTLIWREGMSGWTPLRTARPSAAPSVPSSPVPPAPGLSLEPSAPGAIPSSTTGSDQPQPGWIRCSFTGRYFPPSEIIYLEGKPYSAAAKPQVIAAMQRWADDDLRSLNAQIEYVLRDALVKSGRVKLVQKVVTDVEDASAGARDDEEEAP